MDYTAKIKALLHTGNDANIELALQLIGSMEIDFDFSEYERAYYLLNHSDYLPDFDSDGLKWLLKNNYFDFSRWTKGLAIPDFIFELACADILHLENCGIEKIPASIGKMQKLDMLFLQGNELSDLPAELTKLELVKLDIGSNRFCELPDFICDFPMLWGLDADNNNLKYLPENIGKLTVLQELRVYKNRLEYIPESIGNMKELIVLDLSDNCLSTLPETIKYCSKLESADLYNNRFSDTEKDRIKSMLPRCWIKF